MYCICFFCNIHMTKSDSYFSQHCFLSSQIDTDIVLCVSPFSCVQLATQWIIATRLLCPWDFPDKNTAVGCQFLFQGICPNPGTESESPSLAGRFFTTEPLRKRKFRLPGFKSQICYLLVLYVQASFLKLSVCSFPYTLNKSKRSPTSQGYQIY